MRNSLDFYTSGAANVACSKVQWGLGAPPSWEGSSPGKAAVLGRPPSWEGHRDLGRQPSWEGSSLGNDLSELHLLLESPQHTSPPVVHKTRVSVRMNINSLQVCIR